MLAPGELQAACKAAVGACSPTFWHLHAQLGASHAEQKRRDTWNQQGTPHSSRSKPAPVRPCGSSTRHSHLRRTALLRPKLPGLAHLELLGDCAPHQHFAAARFWYNSSDEVRVVPAA